MDSNTLVLNRLFTQNVFDELITEHNSKVYSSVIKRYISDVEDKKNGTLVSEIYEYLSTQHRNEYYYINTLLNKLLLGKHSLKTTTALTQVPIAKSKADFVLINGKAVVYEVKTELDNLDRLETQLLDYYKAFDHVCVVTHEKNYSRLEQMFDNSSVGIYVLTASGAISKKKCKEPLKNSHELKHAEIFKILRKSEYEQIVKAYWGSLPDTTPVHYYGKCMELFSNIPLKDAYALTLKELKKRNYISVEQFETIPYELKALIYFAKNNSKNINKLSVFLDKLFVDEGGI